MIIRWLFYPRVKRSWARVVILPTRLILTNINVFCGSPSPTQFRLCGFQSCEYTATFITAITLHAITTVLLRSVCVFLLLSLGHHYVDMVCLHFHEIKLFPASPPSNDKPLNFILRVKS